MKRKAIAAEASSPSSGTSLATIDQQLAQETALLKHQIGQPGGRAIKVKNTGFVHPDGMDLGDEIQIIVVDFISKNLYYDRPYDPQNPTPPACFAMDRVIENMVPDPDSPDKQAESCGVCPLNQFGSGANGKSKACKNTRELALLLVDPEDPENVADPAAPLLTLSVTPSALRAFDGMVASVARSLGGPPIKAIVTARVHDKTTYGEVSFVDPIANPNYVQHFKRRTEAAALLERKPDFSQYESPKPIRRPQPKVAQRVR